MSIASYLSKLALGLSLQGVLGPSKGGTGVTTPGAAGNVLVSNGTSWESQVPATQTSGTSGTVSKAAATGYSLIFGG